MTGSKNVCLLALTLGGGGGGCGAEGGSLDTTFVLGCCSGGALAFNNGLAICNSLSPCPSPDDGIISSGGSTLR